MPFVMIWGSARYAANMAFMGTVHAKLYDDLNLESQYYNEILAKSKQTIQYILGENPLKQSYVVGYSKDNTYTQVHKPHHKAATCPEWGQPCDWSVWANPDPNPHILYGALVGGPGKDDSYDDIRNDYIKNEVTCDYNSGFSGDPAIFFEFFF